MSPDAQLRQGLTALRIDLPMGGEERLLQYLALLTKWNRAYNLTAIREPARMVSHHVLDSLSILPHLPGTTMVDVGSGGGLPGIPLAVARPEWSVALVDSNHKKAAFLRQAVIELKLQNVEVITERAERWSPALPFEVVISRAFSDLQGFCECTRHLCGETGTLVAMKGVYPDEELGQLPADIELKQVIAIGVPGLRAARHLVLLRPRRA